VGSEPGSSQFHLFSQIHSFYRGKKCYNKIYATSVIFKTNAQTIRPFCSPCFCTNKASSSVSDGAAEAEGADAGDADVREGLQPADVRQDEGQNCPGEPSGNRGRLFFIFLANTV
jgi:hypothetical protein